MSLIAVVQIKAQLSSGAKYSTVAVVHCETSSGVMNDVAAVGDLVRLHQPLAHYLVDAMSSFGAVPLELLNVDFVVSSANKCLQVNLQFYLWYHLTQFSFHSGSSRLFLCYKQEKSISKM